MGPDEPDIAVVIRCHNQGRFLYEAVASVRGQTSPPRSIVVVDDGSTDCTQQVIESLQAEGVELRTVTRAPARGAVASLNDGIAAAAPSAMICVLDADDRLSPDYLSRTYEVLVNDANLGLAYGSVRTFGFADGERDAEPFDLEHLLLTNVAPVTTLLRRSVYDRLGPFDRRFERLGFEDWEYWVRAAAAGVQGAAVQGCWLEYRRHEAGSRNTTGLMRALRARRLVWWTHRRALRVRHVRRWLVSVLRKQMRGSW